MSKRQYREPSLPIYDPDTAHLTTSGGIALVQLKLEDGRLKKQSYVRLQHTYRVPASMLRQYAYRNCRAYKRRLSNDSYTTLMDLLALTPEKYEMTKTLFKTKDQRLLNLARSELPSVARLQHPHPLLPPTRIAPQSNQYRSYGATNANQQVSQYVPPDTYQERDHNWAGYGTHDDGGEESFFLKLVAGCVTVGLVWWYWRST